MKFSYENILSALLILLVFSLAFVYPFFPIYNQRIPFTDFIFIAVFLVWTFGILTKRLSIKFHFFFLLSAFYLFALFISVIFSANPRSSFFKFLGEVYLVFLTIIVFNFAENLERIKNLTLAWLCGTLVVLLLGIFTIFLFYSGVENSLLDIFQNHYGTVPVGNYPRIKLTFFHSNMLCNYLSVSLLLTIAAGKLGWINSHFSKVLIGLILLISLFTFSPGIGGIALSLGIFHWLYFKSESKFAFAKISLTGGISIAFVFIFLLIFAMQSHPDAPFVLKIPFIEKEFFASSRIMVWSATLENFQNNFWTGIGLGEDVCRVRYLNPSGVLEDLRDGHNTILNVSAQSGILGFVAILIINIYLLVKIFSFKEINSQSGLLYNCFGIAILSAFIYQGLSGSYEETRHLWVLCGLFLAMDKFNETKTVKIDK